MRNRRLTRAEQREQTRERLLDAAVEVFSKRGFHAAAVEDIAEAAGFSKGAVYSNFASKEDLFLALFDRRIERQAQTWHTIGKYIAPVPESTPISGQGFEDAIMQDRTWNVLLIEFFLYAMRDDMVRQKYAARLSDLRGVMREQLAAQFVMRGVVPELPVENLPWVIFALGVGVSIQAYLDPTALPANLYDPVLEHLLS
jgi:AcrR family transcriptional regulator